MREGVKGIIFILNPNPISLNFQESWSFNKEKLKFNLKYNKENFKTAKIWRLFYID